MSNKALNWAFSQSLPPMQKLVLLALADAANEKKGYSCFPGHGRLVEMTGASEKTVQRAIKDLADRGLLTRQRRTRSNGSRTSDLYVLAVTLTDRPTRPNGHSDQAQAVTLTGPSSHSDPPVTLREPQAINQERSDEPDAPKEDDVIQGELVPSDGPKKPTKTPEQLATEDAYEKTGKAFNFIATRGLVKWLIHDRGLPPEMASKAVVMVYEMGKPITKQVLGQLIDGHIRPGGNQRPTTTDRINQTLAMGEELQAMLDQQRKAS